MLNRRILVTGWWPGCHWLGSTLAPSAAAPERFSTHLDSLRPVAGVQVLSRPRGGHLCPAATEGPTGKCLRCCGAAVTPEQPCRAEPSARGTSVPRATEKAGQPERRSPGPPWGTWNGGGLSSQRYVTLHRGAEGGCLLPAPVTLRQPSLPAVLISQAQCVSAGPQPSWHHDQREVSPDGVALWAQVPSPPPSRASPRGSLAGPFLSSALSSRVVTQPLRQRGCKRKPSLLQNFLLLEKEPGLRNLALHLGLKPERRHASLCIERSVTTKPESPQSVLTRREAAKC